MPVDSLTHLSPLLSLSTPPWPHVPPPLSWTTSLPEALSNFAPPQEESLKDWNEMLALPEEHQEADQKTTWETK